MKIEKRADERKTEGRREKERMVLESPVLFKNIRAIKIIY